ncbi:unnamed protein product [Candidula unifasciata]|uniref:Palmitoyltransferase n=1 Tax=Candidula unifasciata TaxID=100452 RepID=A0A8S3YCK5_9EUPU|nr:unnamed protein product [Candidula unifasciata]
MAVFRLDPCGIICILITYLAVFYADYVVVRHIVLPSMTDSLWGSLCAVVFNTIIFLLIVSHLKAVLSDPGIVPIPKTSMDFSDIHSDSSKLKTNDGWTVCMKCETYRPPRAHHCRVCRRCVRRMDHHCPWINNCVGEYNQRFFIQFLFYVGLASVFAITLVVIALLTQPQIRKEYRQNRLLHCVLLVIESILFGLFVIAIGCDQMSAICHDETAVEYVKKEGIFRPKKSRLVLLQEVFGRSHPLLWLWPFQDVHVTESQEPLQYV